MALKARTGTYERRTSQDARIMQDMLRKLTGDGVELAHALMNIINDPDDQRTQLAAISLAMDRMYGKATERVEVGEAGEFSTLSNEDLDRQLREYQPALMRVVRRDDGGEE